MNTLVRNSTLRFSRRFDGYQPLDRTHEIRVEEDGDAGRVRTLSRRRSVGFKTQFQFHHPMMKMTLFSSKRERAQKRHIFLQSYKLSALNAGTRKSRPSRKLKKAVVKVKLVVVSVLSFMRVGSSMKSCNSRSAIDASSPSPIRSCF